MLKGLKLKLAQRNLSGFLAETTSCYLQDLLSSLIKYDRKFLYLYRYYI